MASDVWERLGRFGPGPRQLLLAAVLTVVLLLCAPVAYTVGGWTGVGAALLSMIVCWIGAAAALLLGHLFRGPATMALGVLLPMMVRAGLPLTVLVLIHLGGGLWSRGGLIYYFILFYLITLILETGLALASLRSTWLPPRPPTPAASQEHSTPG